VEAVFQEPYKNLIKIPGIGSAIAKYISDRSYLDTAEKELEYINSNNNEILMCNFKLVPGLNHIFSRIYVYDEDTSSFFAYKDVFVNTQNLVP
jgi:hypothetical protein